MLDFSGILGHAAGGLIGNAITSAMGIKTIKVNVDQLAEIINLAFLEPASGMDFVQRVENTVAGSIWNQKELYSEDGEYFLYVSYPKKGLMHRRTAWVKEFASNTVYEWSGSTLSPLKNAVAPKILARRRKPFTPVGTQGTQQLQPDGQKPQASTEDRQTAPVSEPPVTEVKNTSIQAKPEQEKENSMDDLYDLVGKCVEYARKTGMLQKDAALEETFLQNIERYKSTNVWGKLKRGLIALEDWEWQEAIQHFDGALDMEPECSEAYIGKLLAGKKMQSLSELCYNPLGLSEDKDYQHAIRYAEENRAYYEGFADDTACITLLETVLGQMDCDETELNGWLNLLPQKWCEKSAKLKAIKEQNEKASKKVVICNYCGTYNIGNVRFCKECGKKL